MYKHLPVKNALCYVAQHTKFRIFVEFHSNVYVLACPLSNLSTAEGYLEIDTIFVSTGRF